MLLSLWKQIRYGAGILTRDLTVSKYACPACHGKVGSRRRTCHGIAQRATSEACRRACPACLGIVLSLPKNYAEIQIKTNQDIGIGE